MKALHFGGGNIGRGFIGKVLAENGFEVVFGDVFAPLIEALRERKSYNVNVVSARERRTERVEIAGAVFSNSDAVLDEIVKADLITTAVGPMILERIAPTLAKGITLRKQDCDKEGKARPLNVIACENAIRATSGLKNFVYSNLDEPTRAWADEHVGFVDCAVDRIVPPAKHDDILEVTVEEFCEWVVESKNLKGDFPRDLPNLKVVDDLNAFVERKLMTVNTGHAICAYLGKLYGHSEIKSAIADDRVRTVVQGAMRESGAVLIRMYNMDPKAHEEYIQKIISRYENPYIKDDVDRVGREPIRKLSANDRLVKPLLSCMEMGVEHDNLLIGIAAALLYRNDKDPQAVKLAEMVEADGLMGALSQISGISLDKPLAKSSLAKVEEATKTLATAAAARAVSNKTPTEAAQI